MLSHPAAWCRRCSDLGLSASVVVRPVVGSSWSLRRELVHGLSDRSKGWSSRSLQFTQAESTSASCASVLSSGTVRRYLVKFRHWRYPRTRLVCGRRQRSHRHRSGVLAEGKGCLVQATLLVLESASAVARIIATELQAPDFSRILRERITHIGRRLHVSGEPIHLV